MRIATNITNFSKAPAMHRGKTLRRRSARDRRGELGESIELAATAQAAELLEALGTAREGLTAERAEELRAQVGENVPTQARRAPAVLRLAKSLASPFSLILVVLAGISLYTNVIAAAPGEEDPSTCVIIAVMVLISGILGFVQEDRGIAAAESLRTLVTTTCRLKRAGEPAREVPFAELVPGDIGLATLMWTVPGGAQETGGPYMRDPRHPRHFTDDFKRQIVDLYNAGKPKREIMDEYDLGKSTVERWIKSINATGSPRAADNRTPEQNRILELERENRRLRMEVDVLKQAALIYARK